MPKVLSTLPVLDLVPHGRAKELLQHVCGSLESSGKSGGGMAGGDATDSLSRRRREITVSMYCMSGTPRSGDVSIWTMLATTSSRSNLLLNSLIRSLVPGKQLKLLV